MYKRSLSLLITISLLIFFNSCNKLVTGGSTELSYTGAISGHVSLYDQYGDKVLSGVDSVLLSTNDSTLYPDNTGYYIFNNIVTGQYNITASRNGYASTQTNNFQYIDNTLNKDIKLSAIPHFAPTTISEYVAVATPGDSVVINFTADTRARNCIVFINNSISVRNLPANYLLAYTKTIPANQTKISVLIPATDIYNAGIASGATFYYAAYGYVVGDASVYEDQSTGKNVYNAVSATAASSSAVAP